MKALKKILCAVLCVLMVMTSMVFATAQEATADEVTGFTQEDFLRVKGRNLLLFTADYEINWALDKNPGLVLKEFSQMQEYE